MSSDLGFSCNIKILIGKKDLGDCLFKIILPSLELVLMESPARHQSSHRKIMIKQLTGKRDDSPLHSAAREGNLDLASDILSKCDDEVEMEELLCKQNQSGETALYVAAECGHCDLVSEMMKYYDVSSACIKARNGYDAFHIAAKQGDLGKLPPWICFTVSQKFALLIDFVVYVFELH